MARINSNYLKLPGSYLFAEMKRKTTLTRPPIRKRTSSGLESAT